MTHISTFPADLQGNLLYWVRIVLACLMIGFIAWALIAIRSRNVFQHGASMLRAYAIGQGASTQSFIGIGWMILSGAEAMGPLRDAMMVFAWALNLLIAEVVIWRLLIPKRLQARQSAVR
jgi:hypothetical protein